MSTSARAADRRQVARARVADRHRRVGAEQQLGHRLAEQVRAPDDDGLGALELDAGLLEQQHHARSGCTGAGPRGPSASSPALIGVRPSTSLPGATRPVSSTPSRCPGTGSWTRIPLTLGSALSSLDQRDDLLARHVGGQAVVEAAHAHLGGGLLLAVDVDRARRVVAHEHGRQAGRVPVLGRERGDVLARPARARFAATALPSMILAAMRRRRLSRSVPS